MAIDATLVRRAGRAVAAVLLITAMLGMTGCGGNSEAATSTAKARTTAPAPATAATTATATTTANATSLATAEIHWRACKRGQCGTLAVPLSYNDPGGTQIQLALFRLPAKHPARRIGTILVNPGGPGGSGVMFARLYGLGFPESIRARFDVVGWDPRGVGASDPIDCGAALARSYALDQAPLTAAQRAALATGNHSFGLACKAKVGAILANVSTIDTARDMDRIRATLGERRITYVGYSYGTYLGAVYANMFPTHVRAMVLDGVSDPGQTAAQFLLTQARSLDHSMNQFLADCAKQPSCAFHSGGHPAAAFAALTRKIEAHPLRVDARMLGTAQYFFGAENPLYTNDTAKLAKALAAAQTGNGAPLLASYDDYVGRRRNGTYSSELAANTAINCVDGRGINGVHAALALQHQFVSAAPLFGRFTLYNNAVCGDWPARPQPPRLSITAAGAPPIVVIGSTGDPVTPYTDAVSLAHELRSGVLLTATSKGHTTNFLLGGPCDSLGVPYLLTGKPPKNGSRCVAQHSTK